MAPFDKKRGVYVARYKDIFGQRHAPTFPTEAEADQRLEEEKTFKDSFAGIDIGHTFDEAAETFLAGLQTHRGNTVRAFRYNIRNYLSPYLGGRLLVDMDRSIFNQLEKTLNRSGRQAAAGIARRLLRRIFRKAELLAWLPDDYFASHWIGTPRLFRPPKKAKGRKGYLMLAQVRLFLDESAGIARIIFHLALLAGLRMGEILALCWSDVDEEPGFLSVNKNRGTDGKNGPAKSDAGKRLVPISARLRVELETWRAMTCRGENTDIVWKEGGKAMRWPVAMRLLNEEQIRLGIGSIDLVPRKTGGIHKRYTGVFTAHRFRAACTALWVKQGVPVDRIANWLGHSDPKVTLGIYAYIFRDDFKFE